MAGHLQIRPGDRRGRTGDYRTRSDVHHNSIAFQIAAVKCVGQRQIMKLVHVARGREIVNLVPARNLSEPQKKAVCASPGEPSP